ncbi:MAG: putative sulfate exporter family transporter, partial [Euryarchaeota archaeon]|nr:putative sulfate exporter family transporter [Euryarchaeota archaeon]
MGEARWTKGMFDTEDWWAFWIGIFFILLGIVAAASGVDLTGWIVKFSKWTSLSKAFRASHKDLMGPIPAMIVSYIVFTIVTSVGAVAMKWDLKKYLQAWTIIYVLSVAAYIIGENAYIAATSIQRAKFGIDWSLSLGGAYYILSLLIGLAIGNLAPKAFRDFMKGAARPEWFIKIAIVCLGTKLGLKGLEAAGFATHLLVAGCAA